MSSKVKTTTEELVKPILEEKNLELVDVEYVKEGRNWYLRVFIDKPGGVDILECGEVSEKLSDKLDEVDPIKDPYFLEVSSPGVERPLKSLEDFKKNIDKNVYIKLYEAIDNEKEYEGVLRKIEDEILTIEYKIKTRTKTIEVPYSKVAKARLAVVF